MKTFAIIAALTLFAVAPLAGASDSTTIHGSFVTSAPFGAVGPQKATNGIIGFAFEAPPAGTHLRVHVTNGVPVYDVDIHYFNAAGSHVDSKPDLCDTPTMGIDQECDIPDIGATTVVIDAKYGGALEFDVTITPPSA